MSGTNGLRRLRDLLEEAHRALDLQFGFELWDGSTVPRDLPSYAMRLVIGRESVIAALLRRPDLDTLINAHVAGPARSEERHDLRSRGAAAAGQDRAGGSERIVGRSRRRGRGALLARARATCRGRSTAVKRRPAPGDGKPATNKAEHRLSLRRLERLLPALPRSGDGLYLRLFSARLARRPRPRAARQARHDLPQAAAASPAIASSISAAAGAR